MKQYYEAEKILELFKALDSEPRLNILKQLTQHERLSMNELSEKLDVTQGAVTSHIKTLLACDLVNVREESGSRGIRKLVGLKQDRLLVDLNRDEATKIIHEIHVPVGSYTACEVKPSCALSSTAGLIGQLDDPASFKSPERAGAEILWFASGFVEYTFSLPDDLAGQTGELEISLELSSEAPGICEEWPSDITFSLNGDVIGTWLSPGDYGEIKGALNPPWWDANWNQYGLLKNITVNHEGTFIDGQKLSDYTIDRVFTQKSHELVMRLSVLEDNKNVGGLTLFGAGFGNHAQPIVLRFCSLKNQELFVPRIESIDDGVSIYHALSSEVRLEIISLLAKHKRLNMNELSEKLGVPNSSLTAHIRLLDECGFIKVAVTNGTRGMQKLCTLLQDRLRIDLVRSPRKKNRIMVEIPVGSYCDYAITAPCGVAGLDACVGEPGTPCYFDAPERLNAGIVWFSGGFVEYPIPNYLTGNERLTELQISMEVVSTTPDMGIGRHNAGITFFINQMAVGSWTVPQDRDSLHSLYTPSWWSEGWLQSGKIKLLTINRKGSFIDGGNLISPMTIDHLNIITGKRIMLRIASKGGGGVTIFGRGFGNYNQHIMVRMLYES